MIIAGTGHRPNKLGGYDEATSNRLFRLAVSYLTTADVSRVISGMALGWDQALARAAIYLKIPFIAAIPFTGQENAWPIVSRNNYNQLLDAAHAKYIVCGGGYAGWKMQKRNEWMVDHCDKIAALWDGSSGGTGNCIQYAKQVGKPIDNLWEDYVPHKR